MKLCGCRAGVFSDPVFCYYFNDTEQVFGAVMNGERWLAARQSGDRLKKEQKDGFSDDCVMLDGGGGYYIGLHDIMRHADSFPQSSIRFIGRMVLEFPGMFEWSEQDETRIRERLNAVADMPQGNLPMLDGGERRIKVRNAGGILGLEIGGEYVLDGIDVISGVEFALAICRDGVPRRIASTRIEYLN